MVQEASGCFPQIHLWLHVSFWQKGNQDPGPASQCSPFLSFWHVFFEVSENTIKQHSILKSSISNFFLEFGRPVCRPRGYWGARAGVRCAGSARAGTRRLGGAGPGGRGARNFTRCREGTAAARAGNANRPDRSDGRAQNLRGLREKAEARPGRARRARAAGRGCAQKVALAVGKGSPCPRRVAKPPRGQA